MRPLFVVAFALVALCAIPALGRVHVSNQGPSRSSLKGAARQAAPAALEEIKAAQRGMPVAVPYDLSLAPLDATTPSIIFNMTYTNTTWLRWMFQDGDVVFLDSYYYMLAVSRQSGAIQWAFPDLTAYTVLLTTFDVVILYEAGSIIALQASSGVLVWMIQDPNLEVYIDPASRDELVFAYDTSTNNILALSGRTGNLQWATYARGSIAGVTGGYLYLEDTSCSQGDGCYQLSAYSSTNGQLMWESPKIYGYPFIFTDFSHLGYVIMNDYDWLAKFEVSTGTMLFNVTAQYFTGMIIVLPDALYVSDLATVYRIDENTGQLLWQNQPCATCTFTTVIDEDSRMVYVESSTATSETLWGLNRDTGVQAWTHSFPSSNIYDVEIDHDGAVFYIASSDNEHFQLFMCDGVSGNKVINGWSFAVANYQYQACDLPVSPSNGVLYVVCDINLLAIAVPHSSGSSSNGGKIAGAVIGTLLGVGAIVGGVWYVKKKGGLSNISVSSITSSFSRPKYTSFSPAVAATGTSSSAYMAVTPQASAGAYGTL